MPLQLDSSIGNERPLRTFGVDWRLVGSRLRRALDILGRSRWLTWLHPVVPGRLLLADGGERPCVAQGQVLSIGPADGDPESAREAVFQALELPEDRFLRRTLHLPRLAEAELRDAVALDVAAASPFAAQDLRWAFAVSPSPQADSLRVDAVMTSEPQLSAWLHDSRERLSGQTPETWAVAGLPEPVHLAGEGDAERQRFAARGKRQRKLLAALVALLLLGLLVTPVLQTRAQAKSAQRAYRQLEAQAASVMAVREQATAHADILGAARKVQAGHAHMLKALDVLTTAIPDDAWIQGLKLDGLTVSLTGRAANSASLVQGLEKVPGINSVRLTGPVTRVPNATTEAFSLEIKLAPDPFALALPTEGGA